MQNCGITLTVYIALGYIVHTYNGKQKLSDHDIFYLFTWSKMNSNFCKFETSNLVDLIFVDSQSVFEYFFQVLDDGKYVHWS